MTISNAAVDKPGVKHEPEKASDKLAEKRRALGRGLESLLPGPRVVPAAPVLQQSARKDAAHPDGSPFAPLSSQEPAKAPAPVAATETVELRPQAAGVTADGETVYSVAIEQIDLNPYQTRRHFDEMALQELADSIKVQGVVQPIVLRPGRGPGNDGRFILILGERRLRASRLAGKPEIPAIVKRVSEQQAAEMTLVENLQRQDLNCVEQAEAFANLSKNFKLTQEDIGKHAGISREQVSNYMRLLSLPESVVGALQAGKLTYSHSRALLPLRDPTEIEKFAQKAIEEKLSVAKLEELVLGVSQLDGFGKTKDRDKERGQARWVDPNVKAAQRAMEEILGMRVRIRDRQGKGKIVIEYATIEDFDRVVEALKGK
jgi:ParB family chromosome partitioning protein